MISLFFINPTVSSFFVIRHVSTFSTILSILLLLLLYLCNNDSICLDNYYYHFMYFHYLGIFKHGTRFKINNFYLKHVVNSLNLKLGV